MTMGEARRRANEIVTLRAADSAWLESLAPAHRTVADVALRLHSKFVVPHRHVAACYPLAFFLHLYLWREHRVRTRAVVGFVCDGTSPVQMSHAWLDFDGAKTDVSLTITEHPRYVPPGALLILDRVWQRGMADYTYHLSESAESVAAWAEDGKEEPRVREVRVMKEIEHAQMLARADDDDAMWSWLSAAPSHMNYEAMAAAVRRR
jgi:hypothetical protein